MRCWVLIGLFATAACGRVGYEYVGASERAPALSLFDVSLASTDYADGLDVRLDIDEVGCNDDMRILPTRDATPPATDAIDRACADIESFDLGVSDEGEVTVYLWAVDGRRRMPTPSTARIVVDLAPPQPFAITAVDPPAGITGESFVRWSWQAADDGNGSGIAGYTVAVFTDSGCVNEYAGPGYSAGGVDAGNTTQRAVGPFPFSTFTATVTATDRVGRSTETDCFAALVEVQPLDRFVLAPTGPVAGNTASAWGASFADVNGDDALDLLVTTRSGTNPLFLGAGDGTFVEMTLGDAVTDTGSTGGGVFGDLNGDGTLDLVVSSYYDANNWLYFNDGAGLLTGDRTSVVTVETGHNQGLVLVDLEPDHDLDILIAESNPTGNLLYRNDGTGAFTRDTTAALAANMGTSEGIAFGDLDLDGHLDFFISNQSAANHLFFGNGDGTYREESTGVLATTTGASMLPVLGDIDGDGDLDLFVGNANGANNHLFRNDGDGTFLLDTTGPVVSDGGHTLGGSLTDIDCDGDLDLFVGNYGGPDQLYLNPGDGNFVRASGGPTAGATGVEETPVVALADVDGDGYAEIYAGNDHGGGDQFYFNSGGPNTCIIVRAVTDGDGNATDSTTADDRDAIGAHVWVDLDGDGDFAFGGDDRLLLQVVDSGDGDNRGGNGFRLAFGLGRDPPPPKIRVRFPDGSEVTRALSPSAFTGIVVVRDPG